MTAVTLPTRPERPVSALASAAVFVGRSIRHSLRDVEALTMAIVLPVMLMLLFTFVFGGALDAEGDYVQYVVPGIILLCAGFGASSTAVDVARDMSDGIVDRWERERATAENSAPAETVPAAPESPAPEQPAPPSVTPPSSLEQPQAPSVTPPSPELAPTPAPAPAHAKPVKAKKAKKAG